MKHYNENLNYEGDVIAIRVILRVVGDRRSFAVFFGKWNVGDFLEPPDQNTLEALKHAFEIGARFATDHLTQELAYHTLPLSKVPTEVVDADVAGYSRR